MGFCVKVKSFLRKKNIRNFFIIFCAVILITIIFLSSSFANLTPISTVSIQSENLVYSEAGGSFKITKNAKWIGKGLAKVTIDISSVIKRQNLNTDVIFVLDTSASMTSEKLYRLKNDVKDVVDIVLENNQNKVSLITFNDKSSIVSDFTSDGDYIKDCIDSLSVSGNTNYYAALLDVETILNNYTYSNDKDCVVLFLTDGWATVDTPNEIGQYEYLKSKFPYITVNSIEYELEDNSMGTLSQISDNIYNASLNNLSKYLYIATSEPVNYDNFKIYDYVDSDYFEINGIYSNTRNISNINYDDNILSLDLSGLSSGDEASVSIILNLKEELLGIGGVYPVSEKMEIRSLISDYDEDIVSELTPILADNYSVTFDVNPPNGCDVSNSSKNYKFSVYDKVEIKSDIPVCEGYEFKEWRIVTKDIEKFNDNYFIMPEKDVLLRGTWMKLVTEVSMDGEISKIQTLYEVLADNSVPDNVSSEFVSSSSGISFSSASSDTNGKGIYLHAPTANDEYPIYYYRGDVNNNNLIFADFCWKIVRTTETGGVKLIYNGKPEADGSCTATGEDATAGYSPYNYDYSSLAYTGYMHGTVYPTKTATTSIVGIGGKTSKYLSGAGATNYIYSSSVNYVQNADGEYVYQLVDGVNKVWSDTYAVGTTGNQFLYTCLSETESSCSTVYYTYRSDSSSAIYYVELSGGEKAEDIMDRPISFGRSVNYNQSTRQYTLQNTNTIASYIRTFDTAYKNNYMNYRHYTCFNSSVPCTTVQYMLYIDRASTRGVGKVYYIELTDGKKVYDVVKEMTTNSTNETNSDVKDNVDSWFAANLLDDVDKLEDTPWCNERSISDYGVFSESGMLGNQLEFTGSSSSIMLSCSYKNNAYTVSDIQNGNGALIYPVGLLTVSEHSMAGTGSSSYLNIGKNTWTMTPESYVPISLGLSVNYLKANGSLTSAASSNFMFIRPAISLKPGTIAKDGDGTAENPYIVS